MKEVLLIRLGGLGDCMILTCVAKEFRKRGYEVDACIGSPTGDMEKFLGNTGLFRRFFKQTKAFNGLDVYEDENGDMVGVELLKERYEMVVDYKYSIELNSHYKHLSNGPGREWIVSQNSNYVNWVDMMFAWANIDPESVKPEDKVPVYIPMPDEIDWAKGVVGRNGDAFKIAVQTNASSLVRTWYSPERLPNAIREAFPERKFSFLVFDGARWHVVRGGSSFPLVVPDKFDPIRASAALIAASDLFIGADSGFSHVAEAVGVNSITIYTTVPAWTRMKYYAKSRAVEPVGKTFDGVECRPCFVLDRYCPRIRERALKQLTPRELKIKELSENRVEIAAACRELKTTPAGLQNEARFAQERFGALLEMQAPCSETITPERIIDVMREFV